MKRLVAYALFSLSAVGPAAAQAPAPEPFRESNSVHRRFHAADTDGNGTLEPAEARAAGLWYRDDYVSVDFDRSGTVSLGEVLAAMQARLNGSLSEFDAADADGDGLLSEEEALESPALLATVGADLPESSSISRPEFESYVLDRIFHASEMPAVAPNLIEKKF